MKNMKWRAWHFLNPDLNSNKKETFKFKSTSVVPYVEQLETLKEKLENLTRNLEFKENIRNNFQHQLKKDLKTIRDEKRVFVPADKSTNYYKVEQDTYKNLLHKNITKDYKKANRDIAEKIDLKDKEFAEKLEIEDRVHKTSNEEVFNASVKVHQT